MIEENRDILDKPEEKDDSSHWKWGIFYYNRNDKKLLHRKRIGWSWTINFANPYSLLFLLAVISLFILLNLYFKK
jgi:uncharacterized membrane protein